MSGNRENLTVISGDLELTRTENLSEQLPVKFRVNSHIAETGGGITGSRMTVTTSGTPLHHVNSSSIHDNSSMCTGNMETKITEDGEHKTGSSVTVTTSAPPQGYVNSSSIRDDCPCVQMTQKWTILYMN